MSVQEEKKPRVTLMGEEIDLDELPAGEAAHMEDYFKPVKLSPRAIDEASRIVPRDTWEQVGLYTWLRGRADLVFSKLPISQTEGRFGKMKYVFEFDAEGPVLKSVALQPASPSGTSN